MISTRKLVLVVAAGALALSLAGCSTGGSKASGGSGSSDAAPAQTRAQACDAVKTAAQDGTEAMSDSFSKLTTDPSAALVGLKSFSTTFHAAAEKVGNADVKKAVDKADASLTDFITQVGAYVADPASVDTAKLTAASTAFSTDFSAIGKVCS